jgi:phage recombination protein Bet
MNQIINYPSLLLSKDNKEVTRFFDEKYVEGRFKYYLSLKIPLEDIVTFFHKAQVTGADPLKDQIYLIPRNTKIKVNGRDEYVNVGTIVFSYHFVEAQAVMTKEYEGFTIETGVDEYFDPISTTVKKMLRSKCVVVRNGKNYPYTAWWDEYVQTNSYGVTAQWKTKPYLMLDKCAKAGALRSAFPEWLSGAYTEEEMGSIEKNDQAIEAEFNRKDEAEKVNEIQERIDQKLASTENVEKISGLMDSIQSNMAILTKGCDIATKGKAMTENLGVSKFQDLKSKSLEELTLKDKELAAVVKEKSEREFKAAEAATKESTSNDAKKSARPTFIVEP